MTRTFFGLSYRVHSPTSFELVSVQNDINEDYYVTVSRNAETNKWTVNASIGTAVYFRSFATRDECFALLASRRATA